jgi:hypothetical protein
LMILQEKNCKFKNPNAAGIAQIVECLTCKREALSSTPSTAKKKI